MIGPARYPNTDAAEQLAINTLLGMLDPRILKPDIRSRDKVPNSDGTIEIVDTSQVPQGKVEVQVRSIPAGRMKYSCSASLVAYFKTITLPFVLICVDAANRRAFWRRLHSGMSESRENQQSFTLHFDETADSIDSEGAFVQRWLEVIQDCRQRIGVFVNPKGNHLMIEKRTTLASCYSA